MYERNLDFGTSASQSVKVALSYIVFACFLMKRIHNEM